MDNQRDNIRVECRIPVVIAFKDKKEFLQENILNISLGGMFIKMIDAPPVGALIEFIFAFDKEKEEVSSSATVIWSNTGLRGPEPFHSGPGLTGCGIKFLELPPKTLKFIQEMVEKKQKALKKAKFR